MKGSIQFDRAPPALDPASFLIDETPLCDLLAMTRDYAHALTFIGDDRRPAGTWSQLLDHDPAVLMARAASQRLDARNLDLLDDFAAGRGRGMARHLRELAAWAHHWFGSLWQAEGNLRHGTSSRLERLLLRGLAPELSAIDGQPAAATLEAFVVRLETWLETTVPADGTRAAVLPGDLRNLRRLYFAFIEALGRLQAAAGQDLGASLSSGGHEPAAALLVALAQVFQRVQARVNRFTARQLDFYYKEVLGFRELGATLDSAHVAFERDRGVRGEVVIPVGQPFLVGQAPDGTPIVFKAQDALSVGDARVMQLKTLRLERDALISPEREFGYVTRAKVAAYGPQVGPDGASERRAAALMGGDVLGCVSDDGDARIGLAIGSPILWLKEGERQIDLTLELNLSPPSELQAEPGGPAAAPSGAVGAAGADAALKARLMARFRHTGADDFFRALGDLFAAWVLSDRLILTDADAATIRQAAYAKKFIDRERLGDIEVVELAPLPDDASPEEIAARRDLTHEREDREIFLAHDLLSMMIAPLTPGERRSAQALAAQEAVQFEDRARERRRLLARDEFYGSAFKIEVSTASGWLEIVNAAPTTERPPNTAADGFFRLLLDLTNEDPPVVACTPEVHGAGWPTETPVLRLTLQPQSRLFPLSLFANPTLKPVLSAVTLLVTVEGVRTLQAHNQNGQLDPSKPFVPFGPLPDTSSYLVIGSPEAARKTLTRHVLSLDWSGLPPEGFAAHYAAYGQDAELNGEAFAVKPYVLRDGRWADCGADQVLFEPDRAGDLEACDLVLGQTPLSANWRATSRPLVFDQNARRGFVKYQLSAPRAAFGHQLYPTALAAALRPAARGKPPAALPSPPYTPTLNRVTLAYNAETRIVLGDSANATLDRVLLLHPFGAEVIHPAGPEAPHPVLPRLDPDGQLLIGLAADQLQGDLTLLFELREDTAVERLSRQTPKPQRDWAVLVGDRWQPLDVRHIVEDTTHGFLASGLVRFDLPAGLTTGSVVLPGDQYWLRLSSNALSGSFGGLLGVRAQALRATRVAGQGVAGQGVEAALDALSITTKSAVIPGVVNIVQPERGFGFRRAESEAQARTRISERLRHKARASTPWDFERLVLEQFPSVQKVRCLPNTEARNGAPRRGEVLVVVVPAGPRNDPRFETRSLQLDALELERIASYLPGLASPFARLTVRNATYDFIQVRCRVELKAGAHPGDVVKRINSELVSFLSPWRDGGYAADFDWTVRSDDLEACILGVEDVASVTGISLIRVWEDNSSPSTPVYRFEDTAVSFENAPVATLSASRPWSLALPLADHFIEVVEDGLDAGKADRTGVAASGPSSLGLVAGLQIGETFIVGEPR